VGTEWLAGAIIYEIYPQSFADTNGDGIGDFRGVIDRLDHLAWLGVNTIWFNPCFDSPFVDAGYDVQVPRALRTTACCASDSVGAAS
jgi:maltose alpha-D-glucosyltransferase/alpha-amylase